MLTLRLKKNTFPESGRGEPAGAEVRHELKNPNPLRNSFHLFWGMLQILIRNVKNRTLVVYCDSIFEVEMSFSALPNPARRDLSKSVEIF